MKLKSFYYYATLLLLSVSTHAISATPTSAEKVIGSDLEERIVVKFNGILRNDDGLIDVYSMYLENVSDSVYEIYVEPDQFNWGSLILTEPSTPLEPSSYLGSIFDDEGFRRDHFRPGPEELVKLLPGEKLDYSLKIGDYVNFEELEGIEKVDINVMSSIKMYDEGADLATDLPLASITITSWSSRVKDVPLRVTEVQ